MARLTAEGIIPRTLAEIIADNRSAFLSVFGSDLDFAAESPSSQFSGVLASIFSPYEDNLVVQSNAMSPRSATGRALDDLYGIIGVVRNPARYSSVPVTIAGTAGTILPVGTSARTINGDVFALRQATTIGAGGTVTATMYATEAGPVAASTGALNQPLSAVAGWRSITNPNAATLGAVRETDALFRERYRRIASRNARGTEDAIRSAVAEVADVLAERVEVNRTSAPVTRQAAVIAANTVALIVDGGTDADIASAVDGSSSIGTPFASIAAAPAGSRVSSGGINFTRAVQIPISISVTGTAGADFPTNGDAQISALMLARVRELRIGTGLNAASFYSDILNVGSVLISSATVSRKTGAEGTETTDLNLWERLSLAAADITINIT